MKIVKNQIIVRIKDIMSKNPTCIDSEKTIMEAAQIMTESRVSSAVITKNSEPIGILRDRDFVEKAILDKHDFSDNVQKIMSSPLIYADPNQTIWDIVDIMRSRGLNSLPVINENDSVVGMIKYSDFLKAFTFD